MEKAEAYAEWIAKRPSLAEVLAALAWQCLSAAWMEQDGKFVPHPKRYIKRRRWEDEEPPAPGPTRTRAEAAGLAAVERFARAGGSDAPK